MEKKASRMPQERRPTARPSPSIPVKLKDASVLLPTAASMFRAITVARGRGDVVTSGREGYSGDGVHRPDSQHYQGTAIDLRFASNRQIQVEAYRVLGYEVISEADHLHVELT
jgi:hypothetical protein